MARIARRTLRDIFVSSALIAGAFVVFVFWRGSGRRPRPDAQVPKATQHRLLKTPVPPRSAPLWPHGLKRWLRVRKGPVEEPPVVEPAAEPSKEEREAEEAERRAREAALKEDATRREAARAEIGALREYADLLPARDVEYYQFLLNRFGDSADRGIERPENFEGLFLNMAFFAAGSWGKNPELHRAWVYLLRALGIDAGEEREQGVLALTDSMFQKGMQETREIETAVFGAPLEGGDPWYWEEVGYPPLQDCEVAWEARNDAYMALWWELLDGLERLLTPEDFERVREFFELCNLKT